jgi:maltose alpha-D-glucosyltransferase/alpha-amylase
MPGVPFIYYGDEIGLRSTEGLPSKEGGFGRTGARTPMQWDDSRNAGFSIAPDDRLYLPVPAAADRPSVAAQEADPASSLHAVRELIVLRKAQAALGASGDFTTIVAQAGKLPFVYERTKGGERILVALNPSAQPCAVPLPPRVNAPSLRALAGETAAFRRTAQGWTVQLPAVSYAVVKVE